MTFDWAGLERALRNGVRRSADEWRAEHLDERLGVVALDHVYYETDGTISLPSLALISFDAHADAPEDIRWSTADWDDFLVDWLPDSEPDWAEALTSEAGRGGPQHWHSTFQRYVDLLVQVCIQARAELAGDAIVVLLDKDDGVCEEFARRVLSPSEVDRLFPRFSQRASEAARLAVLTDEARAAALVSKLDSNEAAEKALRSLGAAALRALLPLLRRKGRAWRAAKIIAAIGQPDDDAVRALTDTLDRPYGARDWDGQADQGWAAAALSRLGRLDLVLDRVGRLPDEVVAGAIADRYGASRDESVAPPPLDYRPIETVLQRWPDLASTLDEAMRVGFSACAITVNEVDEAIRGLVSPHAVIRRHAVDVLGNRKLGKRTAARILPLLGQRVQQDPDPEIRRLAIFSLLWWRDDSRSYAEVIRAARGDTAQEVRAAASRWLEEQKLS